MPLATRVLRAFRFWLAAALALLMVASGGTASAQSRPNPEQGPGGPILVLTAGNADYGKYYAEILRAEGLNHFTMADVATLSASALAGFDVVVLAKTPLTSAQVTTLTTWVQGGGNLVAMAPDAALLPLLGLTSAGATLSNAYLHVDTSRPPGGGIVNQTMQFHGTAARFNLNGAEALATLYSDATTATPHPALTLRAVGAGRAAAFSFDLATSIVQTRQGNPAWAASERDGSAPIRPNDKFYGPSTADPQPNWVDWNKIAIPQADEQQRLFANLILLVNANRKPLPRFWYFPSSKKAVIVMTGDDHGNGGTAGRFDQYRTRSAPGCSVGSWECIRGTSYVYPSTPLTPAQAAQYAAEGFEVGVHVSTLCSDYSAASLGANYSDQISTFSLNFPGAGAPRTQRHHCVVWSDWVTGALVQAANGIHLDTTYYYWPPAWVNNVPGVFTGSAMPMRFADQNGSLVDVYMAATQMTDESAQSFPFTVDTLLDRALGAEGYYGAYVVNAHTDVTTSSVSDAVIDSAVARGVSVITANQLLNWVDGRNASSFGAIGYSGNALSFTVSKDAAATGLTGMLPARHGSGTLVGLTRGGAAVAYTLSVIKGVDYAMFDAASGSYVATYASDTTGPTITTVTPASGATNVDVSTTVTVTFNEPIDPATISSNTFFLTSPSSTTVAATLSYDAGNRRAVLTPQAPLADNATYTVTVRGGAADPRVKDAAGNALAATQSWAFTTALGLACPCSAWDPTVVPSVASVNDPNSVEVGVKFTSDVAGYVTGVRFYKGPLNTGTHTGNLWTATGTLLATAVFTSETATGWQQVTFANPVAIDANTVYVASYHAPAGGYAADSAYFANASVYKAPIRLLQSGTSGGNGVYVYSSASAFPTQSFNATNYWVDVVFSTAAPADTTPPTVTSTSPAAGATNVSASAPVTATFSEPMQSATLTTTTFTVRGPGNVAVPGTVSYNAATRTASFTPSSPLTGATSYTASVVGGAADPRVKDLAGNALATTLTWTFTTSAGCSAAANAIVAENCLAGNPSSEWDVSGAGDPSIQGFATDISVNRGSTVSFKINTTASAYRLDIYRMGYYSGLGARKVATVTPSAALPQAQPACLSDAATGLIDCGNWGVSASWAVPATAVSGIYFAKLVRNDTGAASHVFFIVRNDASASHLVFQTSDTTWQAYNTWGGNSLYVGSPAGRAYKVSYNRPFNTRIVDSGQDWVFNAEYPMVRWLEANGYDVSYISGIDTDRAGALLTNHRAFLSVGHDEYWSAAQRANVEAARNAGVHLGFFSGNEVFWKVRWENSIDGSGAPYRTLVSYKETHANAKIDPNPAWTGTWRDPRFSPPADGGRPENALTGTLFMVNGGATTSIIVPAEEGKLRLWRNTSVATLAAGQSATLPFGTLGYEWDIDADNGFRPPGLMRLSDTTVNGAPILLDNGSTFGSGTANHALTLYRHSSGARVFGAGTVQWSWGLDAVHDRPGTPADARMQQATVNLFADMGVQPATLQAGLVSATATTDTTAPVSAITSPLQGSNVSAGPITITGTASDAGGGVVGGVEVSMDGGATWRRAVGRSDWTFSGTTPSSGNVTIRTRAVDDSGNLEVPGSGVTITVGPRTCPCTIWPASTIPLVASASDGNAVNLGVRFRASENGFISGVRFFKGSSNVGTHVGTLWSSAGVQLASATFTNETATGWQQVSFASPVAVTAGTDYVASYHAPSGGYSIDANYFATAAFDNPPLQAPQNGVGGGNGLYAYGAAPAFPTSSFQSSNYWVDVVFTTTGPADTTPPTVSARSPASGATGVAATASVTVTFNEAMDAATIGTGTIQLRDAGNALVTTSVTYDAGTRTATMTPSASLTAGAAYTASVRGGAADPRVKDVAGNALAATETWTFTVAAAAPTITARSPAAGATGVAGTTNVTVTFGSAMDATSITASSFVLRDAANAVVAAAVTYDAGTRVATLNPTPTLTGSGAYTAIVVGGAGGVKTSAGTPMAADSAWSFTIEGTAPTITARSPAPGATGVSSTINVTATFSEAMNPATIGSSSFELRTDANALVAATVTYNTGTNVATLDPTAALVPGRVYTARVIGGVARDIAGNALAADDTWSFTIAPPTVSSRTPAAGATGVSSTTNVTATFSLAMDPATVNASTFVLRDAANVIVPSAISYDAATRVATLNPTPNLSGGVIYTATVVGGASGVKTVDGGPLAANVVWSFTIEATRPTISSRTPASGATGVSRTGNITVTFSEAMDPASITSSSFQLRDAANALVAAVVTYDAATRVATLNPTPTLLASTVHTATVTTAVRDVAGNTLAANSVWSFTTQADTTAPTISARTPASGAFNVSRGTSVTVTFSEEMAPATINGTTIDLRNPAGTVIAATVSYDAVNRRATLQPSATLAAFTTYTARVRGGTTDPRVKDLAGNALASTSTWTFITGP
jgi:hypothetical protein